MIDAIKKHEMERKKKMDEDRERKHEFFVKDVNDLKMQTNESFENLLVNLVSRLEERVIEIERKVDGIFKNIGVLMGRTRGMDSFKF